MACLGKRLFGDLLGALTVWLVFAGPLPVLFSLRLFLLVASLLVGQILAKLALGEMFLVLQKLERDG